MAISKLIDLLGGYTIVTLTSVIEWDIKHVKGTANQKSRHGEI